MRSQVLGTCFTFTIQGFRRVVHNIGMWVIRSKEACQKREPVRKGSLSEKGACQKREPVRKGSLSEKGACQKWELSEKEAVRNGSCQKREPVKKEGIHKEGIRKRSDIEGLC
jgi:hypothetical protein